MYVCMYVCMHVCTKSFLKTTTNSSCVCTHLANKADSDSDSDVVLHCPAEIHKAFPEIDVVWRGAYVALKPLYTFQHS